MDEASATEEDDDKRYGLQVTIEVGGKTESHFGRLNAFGYEAADVER